LIGSTFARLIVSSLVLAVVSGIGALGAQSSSRAYGLDSSKSDRAVTVWAVGNGNAYTDGQSVTRLLERGKPDRFLYLGDVYENGTPEDFEKNYRPSYGRLAKLTAPTPGNHEWPLHTQGYDVFWRGVLKKAIPKYYKFTIGGWDILSLNSEAPHDESSAQVRWLRSKVKRPGACRLAFWHRPRYSDGQLIGDAPDVEPFWDALRGRATIVLNGHDHSMQRFRPIDGITQLIVGSGGHGHHPLKPLTRRSVFAQDVDYGALRLTLKPGQAKYRFVAVDGRTLDTGTIRCKRLKAKKKRS
jgi:calcineurin-like phosphoesterase family protein